MPYDVPSRSTTTACHKLLEESDARIAAELQPMNQSAVFSALDGFNAVQGHVQTFDSPIVQALHSPINQTFDSLTLRAAEIARSRPFVGRPDVATHVASIRASEPLWMQASICEITARQIEISEKLEQQWLVLRAQLDEMESAQRIADERLDASLSRAIEVASVDDEPRDTDDYILSRFKRLRKTFGIVPDSVRNDEFLDLLLLEIDLDRLAKDGDIEEDDKEFVWYLARDFAKEMKPRFWSREDKKRLLETHRGGDKKRIGDRRSQAEIARDYFTAGVLESIKRRHELQEFRLGSRGEKMTRRPIDLDPIGYVHFIKLSAYRHAALFVQGGIRSRLPLAIRSDDEGGEDLDSLVIKRGLHRTPVQFGDPAILVEDREILNLIYNDLTGKEAAVFNLINDGFMGPELAKILKITTTTLRVHIKNIKKLAYLKNLKEN
jgi:hypothetical protein